MCGLNRTTYRQERTIPLLFHDAVLFAVIRKKNIPGKTVQCLSVPLTLGMEMGGVTNMTLIRLLKDMIISYSKIPSLHLLGGAKKK
jgi:hypothetical protein